MGISYSVVRHRNEMKLARNLIFSAVFTCVAPIALWLWVFWTPWFSHEHVKWSEFGSFLGGVLSPLLAFASFLGLLATINEQRKAADVQRQQADDLNYFNHASASLQRAYETLTRNGTDAVPRADRLAWLSCARLLLSAEDVSKRISEKSAGVKALYEGEREHWRRKFYELFHPKGQISIGARSAYFAHTDPRVGINLEERSIRVVFEFFDWPEGKPDPVDTVPKYTESELNAMNAGMSGVRDYIRTMPRFHARSDT